MLLDYISLSSSSEKQTLKMSNKIINKITYKIICKIIKMYNSSCLIIFREADTECQDEQQDHLHLDRRGANAGHLLPSPDYPEVFEHSETTLL